MQFPNSRYRPPSVIFFLIVNSAKTKQDHSRVYVYSEETKCHRNTVPKKKKLFCEIFANMIEINGQNAFKLL